MMMIIIILKIYRGVKNQQLATILFDTSTIIMLTKISNHCILTWRIIIVVTYIQHLCRPNCTISFLLLICADCIAHSFSGNYCGARTN
jgi:hypothetical protein